MRSFSLLLCCLHFRQSDIATSIKKLESTISMGFEFLSFYAGSSLIICVPPMTRTTIVATSNKTKIAGKIILN